MSGERRDEWIVVTEDAKTLPVIEILTGRGFITGKSGSGKSNSASVIAEELLESGYNLLIVDTEGEYFGLKERFEVLHVGGDEFADVRVGPSHAEKVAEIAIKRNMPVILDVSGYDDTGDSRQLITDVLAHLYHLEKSERKPFLVMVEEMQEYLPQQGGGDELAQLLERIAKRGRKRGLGICGMSQRPSSVDKDFITQCDWMIWHRLTWETDINVVRNILGSDRAQDIQDFDPGEGILMTDWDDAIETVAFRRKRTHDAGATPGLESYDRPDLKAVGAELIQEIKGKGATVDVSRSSTAAETDEPVQADEGDTEQSAESGNEADEPTDIAVDTTDRTAPESADHDDPVAIEQRRNELLTAEIEELRSILDGVEGRDGAPTVPTHNDSALPEPPRPPRRPRQRTGFGGNLVEFAHLMVFLGRSAWYRLRMTYWYHFSR